MRKGLVTGIALALVLSTMLWRAVDRRREQSAPRADAPGATLPVDTTLSAFDTAGSPADSTLRADEVSDSTAAAREPLDAAARPIRGRLLDGHCGPPISSGVRLELSSRNGPVTEVVDPGPDGSFATTRAFSPGRVQLRVLEARSGEELLEKALTFDPTRPVWTMRADLGLVIPFDLENGVELPVGTVWAYVVEQRLDKSHPWKPLRLRGGDRPFVHYRSLTMHDEAAISATLQLLTDSPDETSLLAEAPLTTTHGVHPVLTMALPETAHAFGRVVDENGQPIAGAHVWLLPTAGAEPVDARAIRNQLADEDGAFRIGDLDPGPYVLRAALDREAGELRRVELREGENDLGMVEIPTTGGGTIRGRVSEMWTWRETVLISITDHATQRRWFTNARRSDEAATMEFEFRGVPASRFEVRPLPMVGLHFEPASRAASTDVGELEFRAVREPAGTSTLRVLDAESREPFESYVVACRIDGVWVGAGMSSDSRLPFEAERYVISAREHGATVVANADVRAPSEAGGRAIELRDRTDVLVFVDGEDESALVDGAFVASVAASLAGVRVVADGRTVAMSDADGLAILELGDEPGELRFELAGRTAAATSMEEGLRFVWMIRE